MATFTAQAEARVTLNAKEANASLAVLQGEADKLKKKLVELKKIDPNSPKYKNLEKQIRVLEQTSSKLKQTTYDYSKILKNLNGSSLRDLQKTKQTLLSQIKQMNAGTKEFVAKAQQIKQVNADIQKVNSSMAQNVSGWNKITNAFNKYMGIVASAAATITGLTMVISKCKDEASKLSDAYADVMKTTNMSAKEVENLNKKFKEFDTRTSREELNKLAYNAGKLGIAKEDVLGFVKAADMINVALGDVLGDDATKEIGKIAEVFKNSQIELQSMNLEKRMIAIGSAINELGKTSTADEGYLVEFAARLGGVAAQSKISIQNLLGFGSALDQNMQKVEMAATSLSKFIMKLLAEPTKFANIAGIEVQKFNDLLQKDTNEAIKTVIKALGEKGGFQQLIPIFKEMGLDGARAVAVLASLANDIDKVNVAQKISNKAFAEGTSMLQEYDIKNQSLAAKIDKAKKKIADMREEIGTKFSGTLITANKIFTKFLLTIIKIPKDVYVFIAAMIALSLRITILNGLLKLKVVALKAWTAAQILATAASGLFTGNLLKMAMAWRALSASMKTNIFIALATAIYAAGRALISWLSSTDKISKAIKSVQTEMAKETNAINDTFAALKKANEGTAERKKLIDKINNEYGEYLGYQLSEKDNLNDIEIAQRKVIAAMRDAFIERKKTEAKNEVLDETSDAIVDAAEDAVKLYKEKFASAFGLPDKNAQEKAVSYFSEIRDAIDKGSSFSDLRDLGANYGITNRSLEGLEDYYNLVINQRKKLLDIDRKFAAIQGTKRSSTLEEVVVTPTKKTGDTTGSTPSENGGNGDSQYNNQLKEIDKKYLLLLNAERKHYIDREITEQEFENRSFAIAENALKEKIALANKYGKDDTDLQAALLDKKVTQRRTTDKVIEDLYKDLAISEKNIEKEVSEAISEELEKQLAEDEEYFRQREEFRKHYRIDKEAENYESEKDALQTALDNNYITEEEHQKALFKLKLKYLNKFLGKSKILQDTASNMVSAIQEAETAKVDVEYEKRHTALSQQLQQGLISEEQYNAEKEKLDNEAAQKKLDIEKKYADVNFAIKVSQIIADTAVSIMTAYSQLGPIAGSVAAAMLTVTGLAQVASAKAERDRIKNMTLESSAGTNTVDNKKQRVVLEGKESGGYVEREQDGKEFFAKNSTNRGYVSTPTVLVGENGNEFVANNAAVSNPTIKPVLDIIDMAQRNGSVQQINLPRVMSRLNVANGFETGGFTAANTTISNQTTKVIEKLNNLLTDMKDKGINAYIVYSDFEKKQELLNKSKALGSKIK